MKWLPLAIAAVALAVGVFAGLGNDLPLAILGILVALGSLAFYGFATSRSRRLSAQELSNQERTMIRPIQKIHEELEELATQASSEAVRAIAKEALDDSAQILEQSTNLVKLRSDIRRVLFDRSEATAEIVRLEQSLQSTEDAEERASLERALDARKREAGHYVELDHAIARIDTNLKQAEAALSEIKARLAVSAAGPDSAADTASDVQDSIARLKTLSVSFEEAEDLIRGRI